MASFGMQPPSSSSSSSNISGNTRPASITPTDHAVTSPGNDGVSTLTWSPTANILVSGNWDSGIRCWEVQEQNGQALATPKALVNHDKQSPVLSTCFSSDGSTVFSGGADHAVRMWPLGQPLPPPTTQPSTSPGGSPTSVSVATQIGVHDAPVQGVGFLRSTNLVVSGGWDRKLKFWDTRSPTPAGTLDLPERVYSMDVRDNLLVVATAGRHVIAYDCTGPPREHVRKESPLKFQTRCISCFPDSTGFAIGSIEGRVGIHYLQKAPGKDSFAFKCHRQDASVFAVNAICFHNHFGTFATCGSDGVVNFWDKDNKQRLKGFNPIQRTISAANFNATGTLFAYASSYDWSKGNMHVQAGNEIFLHTVLEDEIRQKGKKSPTSGFRR